MPLFLEELTKSILESGELKEAGDHYDYGGSARSVTIPATLRDSLMARLDRFMPVKEIAQIGAAIGREFSYELIAAVAPMPQAQLEDGLLQLSESGLAFRRGTPPDAIYTFKHALVQDAAYDSLLKSRRQELHGKIAHVIGQRFPNVTTTDPNAGASPHSRGLSRSRHSTVAGRGRAGVEAPGPDRSHLPSRPRTGTGRHSALVVPSRRLGTGPAHPPRNGMVRTQRLDCPGGLDEPTSSTSFGEGGPAPRRAAAHLLGPDDEHLYDRARSGGPAVGGGDAGSRQDDRQCRPSDHGTRTRLRLLQLAGRAHQVLQHADRVVDLYDDEKHRHLADILNQDPKTLACLFASISTWILGYPDRALRLSDEKDAHARRRGHPQDLGLALINGAHEFDHRCKHEDLRKRAEACERLGRENNLPVLWGLLAPIGYGQALIREGKVAEAIAQLRASIASWEASGGKLRSPTTNLFLAEGMALTGDLDNALHLIGELIAHAERPGGRNAFTMPKSCASKAGCSHSRVTLKALSETFSPRSTGPAASRRNSGSCARQSVWLDCGRAKANAETHMSCSPRSTTGSPKASTPRICWTPRRCWTSSRHERRPDVVVRDRT